MTFILASAQGSGPLYDLGINWPMVVLQAAGFILLLLFMYKFFWGKVYAHLQERETSIRKAIDDAEKGRADAQALLAEYQKRLAGIEREANEKLQAAVRDAAAERTRILQEAHEARMAEIEKAKAEIRTERDKALIELRRQVVHLTIEATRRALGDVVTPPVQEALVKRYIDEIERA